MKILILDDTIELLEVMALTIEDEIPESEVVSVESYEGFLTAIENNVFDLLIVDNQVPGKEGLEIIRELRNSSNPNKDSAILFFSGCREAIDTFLKAKYCNSDGVAKPAKPNEFISKITKLGS